MKRLLALTLFAALLCGQGGVVINDFTPTVKGVTIGASHCYFWSQLPSPGWVHVGCYSGTTLDINAIFQVVVNQAEGNYTFGVDRTGACHTGATCGQITWIFQPKASAPNMIDFQITGVVLPDKTSGASESGTF